MSLLYLEEEKPGKIENLDITKTYQRTGVAGQTTTLKSGKVSISEEIWSGSTSLE